MDYYVLTPISFILRIFEFFSQFTFVLTLLGKNITIKRKIVGAILFTIIFELGKLLVPQYLNGFASLILGIPFMSIYFKEKFWNIGLAYLLIGIILMAIDFSILFVISLFSGIDRIGSIVQTPILYVLGCLIMSSSLLGIAFLIKKIKEKKKNKFKTSGASKTALINGIAMFLLLLPNLAMIVYYNDYKTIPLLVIIINIIAIILIFFVNTYNTKKGFELVTAEQELITQRTYNKTLKNLVDGLRTFKHDYNNMLQTMYGYIQLNNMTGLKTFFEQILDESRAITALDKLNPELFRNPSLFGIITAKYEYSKQNNVNLDFEIYGELENAEMQIYDLTRILGIFLDNAIEAATGSEKKRVNFMVTERKDTISIEISNTYSEVGLKIEDINKKGISSKGENRGLGLYKVKEILKKYPKVKHETTAVNGMFRQKLVINRVKIKV